MAINSDVAKHSGEAIYPSMEIPLNSILSSCWIAYMVVINFTLSHLEAFLPDVLLISKLVPTVLQQ